MRDLVSDGMRGGRNGNHFMVWSLEFRVQGTKCFVGDCKGYKYPR